jgi:hypothetical protein
MWDSQGTATNIRAKCHSVTLAKLILGGDDALFDP